MVLKDIYTIFKKTLNIMTLKCHEMLPSKK